jgi:hypothetical protein
MKNWYPLLVASVLACPAVFGQSYLGQSSKGKPVQAAALLRLAFNTNQVETALKAYLTQKGYGSSNTHGYILSRGVPLADGNQSDLYFSTSTPDSKAKDLTVLTLIPAKPNQDMKAGTFVDSSKLDAARVFLDSLAGFVSTYNTGVLITNQQDALVKAQKKLGQLRNDSSDYETRLRGLQSDLAQNKSDQTKASADIQSYAGDDTDKKLKYQNRLNKLLEKQSTVEKKIRNTQSDLDETKANIVRQQTLVDQSQATLDAYKQRH